MQSLVVYQMLIASIAVLTLRRKNDNNQARIFLLVDLRDFFFRFMVVRTKKNK